MTKVLNFLRGKKTSITAIISAVLVFLLGRDYIAQDVAYLVSGIMVALGLTINIWDAKLKK